MGTEGSAKLTSFTRNAEEFYSGGQPSFIIESPFTHKGGVQKNVLIRAPIGKISRLSKTKGLHAVMFVNEQGFLPQG